MTLSQPRHGDVIIAMETSNALILLLSVVVVSVVVVVVVVVVTGVLSNRQDVSIIDSKKNYDRNYSNILSLLSCHFQLRKKHRVYNILSYPATDTDISQAKAAHNRLLFGDITAWCSRQYYVSAIKRYLPSTFCIFQYFIQIS